MTHKKRVVLFTGLAALFLIVAPLTVLYCLGWRFDWKTKTIIQPGVFYFKVWPKNVEVYINGEFREKTDIFFGSLLMENLKPQKYNVEIKKDGYHTWQKNLEIKKRQVTETKNIVLVPQAPKFNTISKNIEDFFFSPDGKKIILKENSWPASRSSPEASEGWALKLFETNKNLKSHLLSQKDISKSEVEITDLRFSPDSKKILLELGLKERIQHYLLEIDKVPPVITPLGSLEKPEEFFLISPLEKNTITFTVFNKDIYYLDQQGFLFRNDETLNIIPFEVKKETRYKLTISAFYVLLEENDILYIFDENSKSFQKLSEPIEDFKFSHDYQKLSYTNGYEIWVLFLEKSIDMPQKEKGEKLFIARFSEKIDNLFWYTNHYLIFNVGDKIKVAEIDDRDIINIYDLAEFKDPKIFWSDKKLYILSENNFYISEELVP